MNFFKTISYFEAIISVLKIMFGTMEMSKTKTLKKPTIEPLKYQKSRKMSNSG